MADAPENTLEAFGKALARGCRGLESDVWLSAAGEAVLHHGPPHKEKGDSLPLAELFAVCGTDFDLSLDMKGPADASGTSATERTLTVARDAGFDLRRLWLCGGSLSSARWRALSDEVRLVTDMTWRDAVLHRADAMTAAADAGIDAVNLRHGRWTRDLVGHAHRQGLLAFGWDVQTRWTMRRAVRIGLDGVYSDHPRLLVDVLPR
jgi:glycerophosphoryl diester phosphodiesterase